ncbi:MAG: GNAT family N-acetyltransferase [Planctomycetota bacterium]|nr:GNAT family N-acetyltransferase [Planctomycetota bacterium]
MATLRPATDADSEGVIALIGSIFAEYPGVILDVEREEPELLAPASNFERFWVAEDEAGRVVGCIACTVRPGDVELKKLYVHASARGSGVGSALIDLVEAEASAHAAPRIFLWSDTRFTTAHVVYKRRGYATTGRIRSLHDLSETREFEFEKTLSQDAIR